jgi:hypothetical protein
MLENLSDFLEWLAAITLQRHTAKTLKSRSLKGCFAHMAMLLAILL